jgi:hypothetical protein
MVFALASRLKHAAAVSRKPARKRISAFGQRAVVQAKLKISEPNDRFEQEADRVAEEVMRMPGRTPGTSGSRTSFADASLPIQRVCSKFKEDLQLQPMEEEEKEELLRAGTGSVSQVTPTIESHIHGVTDGGRPLPESVRTCLEPRFGRDFSRVRIHTDATAAGSARAINARAYTVGQHIVFGEGQYAPETDAGRKLLAHELTHTAQQANRGSPSATPIQRTIGDGHDLVASRFSGVVELEAAFDGERIIRIGDQGNYVNLIQQSLLDMGYTLPEDGADGIFSLETKAAVERFQSDASAVKIDGIVGPETMALLDQRDVTNRGKFGPPALVGPVRSPRPTVGGGCAQRFSGVTFTLANQSAAGVTPAALIVMARLGGRDVLGMRGIAPASYQPRITVNASSDARAAEFEVGLIQNVLTTRREYTFTNGAMIRVAIPVPIKDGAPVVSGIYHPIFAENGGGQPGILEQFTANGTTLQLHLPDTPTDFAFVNLLDNPQCSAALGTGTMTRAVVRDAFRTWIGVRHRPSGCVQTIHHIDWNTNWSANVNGAAAPPTRVVTSNTLNVTVANGNGSPAFVQGGVVPADFGIAGIDKVCG